MGMGDELFVALGRVISSSLSGLSNAILGNLISLEGVEDDEEGETSAEEPLYSSLGIYGRPAPPIKTGEGSGNTPEGSAEFVGLRVGDRVYPIAYRDLRLLAKVNPKEGEVGLVQYQGGFISLKENDSGDGTSIVIYAVRNDGSGNPDKASVISIDTTPANSSIAIVHEAGQSYTMNKDGGQVMMNIAGDALLEVNDDGITINAASTAITGACHAGADNPATADFVALGTLMTAELAAIATALGTHTHGYLPGPSPLAQTSPPPAPPYVPGPVISTKFKAV